MIENHIQELSQESILMGKNNTWSYMISIGFFSLLAEKERKNFFSITKL